MDLMSAEGLSLHIASCGDVSVNGTVSKPKSFEPRQTEAVEEAAAVAASCKQRVSGSYSPVIQQPGQTGSRCFKDRVCMEAGIIRKVRVFFFFRI